MTGIINYSVLNSNDRYGSNEAECEYLKVNSGGYTKT